MNTLSSDKIPAADQRVFAALLAACPGPKARFAVQLDTLKTAAAEPDEDKICEALMRLARARIAIAQDSRSFSGVLLGAIQIVGETVITEISDFAFTPEVRELLLQPRYDA